MRAPSDSADLVAQRHPRPDATTALADRDAGSGQPRNEVANQFDRMDVDRGRRQAVADDDGKLIGEG